MARDEGAGDQAAVRRAIRGVSAPFGGGGLHLTSALVFAGAALAEIAGCFAVWAVVRTGASAWWLLPGAASLALFAFLLTLAESDAAGRAFAAYGGVYIAASLLWLWAVEGRAPTPFDLAGAALCLLGAGVILAGASR